VTDKLLVEASERVGLLTVNREARRNALDDETLLALRDVLERWSGDDGVSAVVVRGAGTRAFSAGSDLKELAEQSHAERARHTELGQALGDLIETHPCVVIAAIEGYCLGGGLELALACDYRIAGQGAVLGLPEVGLNALPSWGGTVRLPRVVGVGRAREIVLFGRRLDAAEALAWGLLARVVPEGEAASAALAFAREFAASTDRATVAVAKGLITHGVGAPPRTARHLEYLADLGQLASAALSEGVGRFAAKTKPD